MGQRNVGIEVPTETRRGEPGGIQAATAGARIKTDANTHKKVQSTRRIPGALLFPLKALLPVKKIHKTVIGRKVPGR